MGTDKAMRTRVIAAYDVAGARVAGQLDDLVAFAAELCGTPVALVAAKVGYASPSAFVAAFRREYGDTPRAHFSREPHLTPE